MKEEPAKCQGWCKAEACVWKSGMRVGDELGVRLYLISCSIREELLSRASPLDEGNEKKWVFQEALMFLMSCRSSYLALQRGCSRWTCLLSLALSCPYTCSISALEGPFPRWVLRASNDCQLTAMSRHGEQRPAAQRPCGNLLRSNQASHLILSSSTVVFQAQPRNHSLLCEALAILLNTAGIKFPIG